MHCYRITKYNPKYRNSKGHYTKNEWISVGDIGRIYDSKEFTLSDYLSVEEKYFEAVKNMMDEMKVETLKIKELEKSHYVSSNEEDSDELKKMYDLLEEEMTIKNCDVALVIKLILREIVWAKLVSKSFEVHFGYDYYMYVCSSKVLRKSIVQITKNGLFIEEMRSPYL